EEATETIQPQAAPPDTFLSLKRGGTEIYFVRHGDALPGQEEVTPGDYDAQALSELGRAQAQAVARRMREIAPTAIYSSPTGRAYQTAQAIAQALNLPVVVEPDLREVEIGPIGPGPDDTTIRENPMALAELLRTRMSEIADFALTVGVWERIPGSETSAHLRARVRNVIARIAARHAGERIAVVSHGGAINAYFADQLGVARDYFFPAANTSISVARVNGARSLLMALNDVSHLRDAGLLDASLGATPPKR
ncbi:MAG TPA: histidine phosphatase family protein, partial [Ktedonobacterales bacterium]|nr:histidine phosphatase family protein [Ktedonobacterales bacterium]